MTDTMATGVGTLVADSAELTVGQVADRAGVHPGTVRAWIDAGQLKARKHKGRWLVREDDLERWRPSRRVIELGELTVTEAADMLGLHTSTIRNWIREGKLPARPAGKGRKRTVRGEDVERLLTQQPSLGTTHRVADQAVRDHQLMPPPVQALRRRRQHGPRALATGMLSHITKDSDG